MIKLPYGVSDFSDIATEGYYYVDRTSYVELFESWGEKTLLFIRPRRFGKSLFISMLKHYYGVEYKDDFKILFGKYYIGQQPTPLANQYLVLDLDFSAVNTGTEKGTYHDFRDNVKNAISLFFETYKTYFGLEDIKKIEKEDSPHSMLKSFLTIVQIKAKGKKIYLLIDEYDHFANELLAFNFDQFQNIVGRNGWVRKFYEALKIATKQGVIDRMFITGISPIMLDNLTTGFNISANVSTDLFLNEMMGFKETEVISILKNMDVSEMKCVEILIDLRHWYNGYMFNDKGKHKVYNPEMVLYFAKYYMRHGTYPDDLMDENIASDYGKVRKMFKINESKDENLETLKKILKDGRITAKLTKKYSFEVPWTESDFVSLLYYMGILTIVGSQLDRYIFAIPNFVVKQLYFQYFHQLTLEEAKLSPRQIDLEGKMADLAEHNQLQPIIHLTQDIITQLAQEDHAHFNETSLKSIFTSLFYQVRYYNIFSELEVKKSETEKGRIDILLTSRAPFEPKYQFIFELKYLRKKQAGQFEKIKKEGLKQLTAYVENDETLKSLKHLKAYLIIFVVNKGQVFEV